MVGFANLRRLVTFLDLDADQRADDQQADQVEGDLPADWRLATFRNIQFNNFLSIGTNN